MQHQNRDNEYTLTELQDKLVLDGRQSPILNKIDATRCRSVCLRLSYLAQDKLEFAETVRQLA